MVNTPGESMSGDEAMDVPAIIPSDAKRRQTIREHADNERSDLSNAARPSSRAASDGGEQNAHASIIGLAARLSVRPSCLTGAALVIEDHPLYRDALAQLLRTLFADSKVIKASSMEQALRLTGTEDLRLIVLDFSLPGVSGMEAVRVARQAYPRATLVVVSASEDRRDAASALRAGARLFISKTVTADALADNIRLVLTEQATDQPRWIARCGDAYHLEESLPALTSRQREILVFLIDGYCNKDIGLRLGLVEATVKMHVSAIFRALAVSNRTQAVRVARSMGLGTPGVAN